MLEEKMLRKKVWAVVGANQDAEKYGNMIYNKLKMKKYEVYAVNPRFETINGDPCYGSLSELPRKPDVVNMVVSPQRGEVYLREAAELGIEYIWFQPGTYEESTEKLINELGLTAVQACVLVATGWFTDFK